MNWIQDETPNWVQTFLKKDTSEKSSLIIADPQKLDLHLSYSKGLEKGPIIQRNGDSSPIMEDPELPGSYTVDSDRQRIGSYYILDEKQRLHSEELYFLFAGSYFLYASLPNVYDEPRNEVERIFRNRFAYLNIDSLQGFLSNARILEKDIGTIYARIIDSSGFFKNFLESNKFRKNLPFCEDYEQKFSDYHKRAVEAMDGLYENYPHYISNFHEHKNEDVFKRSIVKNVTKFLELFIASRDARSHEELARKKAKENDLGDIVLMQGCGDLTMNMWNVAFVSGHSYQRRESAGEGEGSWDLLHPRVEPLNDRKYSCFIKWNCSKDHPDLVRIAQDQRVVYPYQIAKLQFRAQSLESEVGRPERHVFLEGEAIGHLIEFAVYGQHICRGGEVSFNKFKSVIREFSDIRHIYKLPNINPGKREDMEFYKRDTQNVGIVEYGEKPRFLFNESTYADVWLFEKGLIQGDRNLRVAALNQAIQFDKVELGAPKDWIDVVLKREEAKKTYIKSDSEELTRGQWRWIHEGRQMWLEVFLERNEYPCTMIGVTAKDEKKGKLTIQKKVVDTESIYFLAHGHKYDSEGCTIEKAAEILSAQKCWDALLLDEGWDVFQLVWSSSSGNPDEKVELRRNQLRCVFWANERKGSNFSEVNESQ